MAFGLSLATAFRVASVCLALACGVDSVHAEVPPGFLLRWGTYGDAPGQFHEAYAIALTPDGDVVTGEYITRRVQKFTPTGELLAVHDLGAAITGMAIDPLGFLYVVDQAMARVLKYSHSFQLVTQWGSRGSGDGQFDNAFAVAVDHFGHVFVSDWGLSRVSKFTSDGVFLTKWGASGTGDGQFIAVNGIACDTEGNVFVADRLNYRVQKFTNEGVFIATWGTYGSGEGQFTNPLGMATDPLGNVYVSDALSGINKFTGDGTFLVRWAGSGSGPGALIDAWALAVGPDRDVFAMDRGGAVVKYGYTPTPAARSSWGRLKSLYR
jgi:hypothetical protein